MLEFYFYIRVVIWVNSSERAAMRHIVKYYSVPLEADCSIIILSMYSFYNNQTHLHSPIHIIQRKKFFRMNVSLMHSGISYFIKVDTTTFIEHCEMLANAFIHFGLP